MNFICLKTAENNFHELEIMGAYPRKHMLWKENW